MQLATAAVVNALWDLWAKLAGKPLWKLLADMSPAEIVELVDWRYLTDALTPEEARRALDRLVPTRAAREAELRETGYPAYTTSVGWLGYSDDKIRRLCREALAAGFTRFKIKVGANRADDIRRAALVRQEIGPDGVADDRRQPALGRRGGDRLGDGAGAVAAALDRGADQPRRRARPRRDRPRARAARHRRRHRRDGLEPRDLQAAAAPRAPWRSARSTSAAWRASTRWWRRCCWPRTSASRSARTPAASASASTCSTRRSSTTSRSAARSANRSIEYVDHLHEHFVDPCVIRGGCYQVPTAAGASITMKPDSLAAHSYPGGSIWKEISQHENRSLSRRRRTGALRKDEGGRVRRIEGDIFGDHTITEKTADVERLLAPIEAKQLLCIGLNYRRHAKETNAKIPEYPILFMKGVNAVQDPGGPIVIPGHLPSAEVDYECELAVVIGRACKNVSREQALEYVLGYTCANDVSARDWQIRNGGGQWCRGKTFDTFAPLGPCLVTRDEIPDPNALKIATILNGERMQDESTSDMIFDVPRLIEFLSGSTTLVPGTVILTGTPRGVGMARKPPRWLQPGDSVTVEIEKIGQLTNPVVAET